MSFGEVACRAPMEVVVGGDARDRVDGRIDVVEREEPAWRAHERTMWEAAVAHTEDPADPALASMQAEGRRSLESFDRIRRLLWTARA